MEHCLTSKKSDCKNCYKCIRSCPTKSISFSSNQANIIHDECVFCGNCFVECPQSTKVIRDDTKKVLDLLKGSSDVYVSIAPSLFSYYHTSYEALERAILKLGFKGVYETALGAMEVKKEYEKILKNSEQDIVISSCCHSVNLLIEKHYPKAIPFLAKVLSPMITNGKEIKALHPNAKVVFIGPCISKKHEADTYQGVIDVVLTFDELDKLFLHDDIKVESEPITALNKSKTRLFPIGGGIINTLDNKRDYDYDYIVVDGMQSCIEALKEIETGNIHKCFIEMSACRGSCINGPIIARQKKNILLGYKHIKDAAGPEDFEIENEFTRKELVRNFKSFGLTIATPSENDINTVLVKKMKKPTLKDQLNCGSCGYNTCREKAIGIIQGKASVEMCLPYLMAKTESFSDQIIFNTPNGILVLNESLQIQLANNAMARLVGVSNNKFLVGNNITSILDPTDYAIALAHNTKVTTKRKYLSEYDKYVEETIIYDEKYHIIIIILRDVSVEEKTLDQKRTQTSSSIEITNKVIEKQMIVAQEIASLLGETTAETKVALTALKNLLEK
ncbi:MAG TPA: [Fe-Fe] hydrogenase large subunit C-terminal domain-containing protein [Candidatus Onthovivens sp.]|nr:[Fe-Fe] hydrogenase large subunit C-terminal domain-containing protein [Candidatus Onthovivens sp.]